MFIDKVRIQVQAGNGGRGCVSFRHEKFVPLGGPDGGDGGKGGDVYLKSTAKKHTLLDFHYRHHFKSERGRHGQGANRTGKSGEDLWILVPIGTVAHDGESGDLLTDLNENGASVVIARGGRGGHGNAYFATATAQAPAFAQEGEAGEQRVLDLELRLIADVGLIGLPNAGKSTLLSKISSAKPKIAPYPFTTLYPLLGAAKIDESANIVVADIPGLIEGASEGHGLGLEFLRHVERTRLLLHLVDVSPEPERGPAECFTIVQQELSKYGKGLTSKPQIVVATKTDVADPKRLAELKMFAEKQKLPFVAICAPAGKGLSALLYLAKNELHKIGRRMRRPYRIAGKG